MGAHRSTNVRKAAPRANDDLPDLIEKFRAERCLSLKRAAKAFGISDASLWAIERRISQPRRTTRLRIEECLRKHGYYPKAA